MSANRKSFVQEKDAVGRLDATLKRLGRQYGYQLFSRHLWAAVFCGFVLSAFIVLGVRLAELMISTLSVTVLIVSMAVVIGGLIAWWRQPGKLTVAILADEKLQMKQCLSTACEFRQFQPGTDETRALAAQAVGRRLPTVNDVFPAKITLWGMLVPLAISLLVLANTVNLNELTQLPVLGPDKSVIAEGQRLSRFARRMKLRAEQLNYPRSLKVSGSLQRLGSAMESGAMRREEAVNRLGILKHAIARERHAALLEIGGNSYTEHSDSTNMLDKSLSLELSHIRSQLSANRSLLPEDMRVLNRAANSLAGAGISSEELQQALDQYASGEPRELQRILEKLTKTIVQNYHDAEQLAEAQAAVEYATNNLSNDVPETLINIPGIDGGANEENEGAGLARQHQSDRTSIRKGSGTDSNNEVDVGELPENINSTARLLSDDTRVLLKPEGKPGEGDSYRAQTWTLPKIDSPTAENMALDARFRRQMEAVISKESYPLHRKEFVRRYFLNLSTGVQGEIVKEGRSIDAR